MNKFINLVKNNSALIFLVSCIIFITAININLHIKLKECSENQLTPHTGTATMMIDLLEGSSLSKNFVASLNETDNSRANSKNGDMLIFTKSENSCGKCLLSILSIWFKEYYSDHNIKSKLKPIVILNKRDYNFLGMLESKRYYRNLLVKINPTFINYSTPKVSQGVCLFINDERKIIFAEELSIENTKQIIKTFKKVVSYLNDVSLNE